MSSRRAFHIIRLAKTHKYFVRSCQNNARITEKDALYQTRYEHDEQHMEIIWFQFHLVGYAVNANLTVERFYEIWIMILISNSLKNKQAFTFVITWTNRRHIPFFSLSTTGSWSHSHSTCLPWHWRRRRKGSGDKEWQDGWIAIVMTPTQTSKSHPELHLNTDN